MAVTAGAKTAIVVEETARVLLGQAQALFAAGATLHAAAIVRRLPLETLEPRDWLDYAHTAIGIHHDACDEAALTELAKRCKHLAESAVANTERSLAAAAAHAQAEMTIADLHAAPQAYRSAHEAFARLAHLGESFALARARFLIRCVGSLTVAGHWGDAESAVRDASRLLRRLNAIPPAVAAELHIDRYYMHAARSETLERAAAEARNAYALARVNGLARTIWVCLYLAIPEQIGYRCYDRALAYARELVDVADASESSSWQRLARSRLALAYSALDRIDEARRVVAALGRTDRSDPAYALTHSGVLIRSRRFREAHAFTGRAAEDFQRRGYTLYRANALMYRATAAWKLNRRSEAIEDIAETIRIYESQHAPALFLLRKAYQLGYEIAGDPRYRAAERDVELALARPARSLERNSLLTPRQREIAELAAEGLSNRVIAARLDVSARTVANHLNAAYASLDIRARWQLPEALARTP